MKARLQSNEKIGAGSHQQRQRDQASDKPALGQRTIVRIVGKALMWSQLGRRVDRAAWQVFSETVGDGVHHGIEFQTLRSILIFRAIHKLARTNGAALTDGVGG